MRTHGNSQHLFFGLLAALILRGSNALEVTRDAPKSSIIDGSYIVELKSGTETARQDVMRLAGDSMAFNYNQVLNGFAVQNIADENLQNLLNSPIVEAIYEDVRNELFQSTQDNAPWGLDRIDSRTGLSGTYIYDTTASDVTIYIVDSGVLATHSDLKVSGCRDFVGTNCQDPLLHGTHVAGTAAGSIFGVAKGARIIDMKVCDNSSCPTSAIIAAMDEIVASKNNGGGKIVANLSLGGPYSPVFNYAVTRAADAGVVVVVAAGNSNGNACYTSPASASGVITVGSTTSNDSRSSFSNYGSCVDVFAPGSEILSASNDGGTAVLSGTSMASPHVAGVAALLLSKGQDPLSEIIRQATPNVVANAGSGSPNRLVYTGLDGNAFPVSPPSNDSSGGFGCFSSSSLVSVAGRKGLTNMSDLKIGDRVLTGKGYEEVYALAHNDHETVAGYYRISTSDMFLEVTGEHLVYLAGKAHPVRADSIKKGDFLIGPAGTFRVQKVSQVQKAGLYAPLTPSGTLIVNDLTVSCYISFFPDGDAETIDGLISHHHFAHVGLSLLRTGCSTISSAWCSSYTKERTLTFIQFGASCFAQASYLPSFLQLLLLYSYMAVLTPLYLTEFLLASGALVPNLLLFGIAIIVWYRQKIDGMRYRGKKVAQSKCPEKQCLFEDFIARTT